VLSGTNRICLQLSHAAAVPAKNTTKEHVIKNKRFMTFENLALWRMIFQEKRFLLAGVEQIDQVSLYPAAVHDRPGSETAGAETIS
jgi:hypothetical protein